MKDNEKMLNVIISKELRKAIKIDAADKDANMSDVVRSILNKHYGIADDDLNKVEVQEADKLINGAIKAEKMSDWDKRKLGVMPSSKFVAEVYTENREKRPETL